MIGKYRYAISALLIGWFAFPSIAAAQQVCAERNQLVQQLGRDYAEIPVSMGLTNDGNMIEVFASDRGTFTIVMTATNGISCLLSSGERWEQIPIRLVGTPL